MQSQTYGLFLWLPYFGNAGGQMDPYVFRSNMYPAVTKGVWEDRTPGHDIRDKDQDYGQLLRMIDQWKRISPNYAGDYYPLTPMSLDKDVWVAWQFNRPSEDAGMVQAFRRDKCPDQRIVLKLRGLVPDAHYMITDVDSNKHSKVTWRELMEKGLTVDSAKSPYAALITYKKS
jgi:alpha-galactosidase